MANKLASNTLGIITDVPINGKNEEYVCGFVRDFPLFKGRVILYKNTKYFEDDGSIHQRHYQYEIDSGKYRRESYQDLKWKEPKCKKA